MTKKHFKVYFHQKLLGDFWQYIDEIFTSKSFKKYYNIKYYYFISLPAVTEYILSLRTAMEDIQPSCCVSPCCGKK